LVNCGAVDIEGDADRDRTEGRGVLGSETDSSAAEMGQSGALSSDELDEPSFPRVARPADLDRDIDFRSSDVRADTSRRWDDVRQADSATIPVKEEQLILGKRKVEGARVRIYGRVLEKPVEQSVQLHDERVVVERRPADRSVSDRDRDANTVTEIRETREEPVVGKQERVVEEVVGRENQPGSYRDGPGQSTAHRGRSTTKRRRGSRARTASLVCSISRCVERVLS
jgi:stress response protein YsnF